MRFQRPPEPDDFDAKVRQPGNAWLAGNIHLKKISFKNHTYWTKCINQLADGFNGFCAYACIQPFSGVVDHYLSKTKHPNQAYEWSNYRYASDKLNQYKSDLEQDQILDPFEVEDDWFEILLPSLQLVITDAVPEEKRQKAEFTLQRLPLQDDERVLRQRREWYKLYIDGDLTLTGLEKKAPLIARAVRKQQANSQLE